MADRSLRVLIAPDSFGGALDSVAVAAAIAARLVERAPRRRGRPPTDGRWRRGHAGGPGRRARRRAERRTVATTDPLGRPIDADWLLLDEGRVAFIEMAAASGLARLTTEERTPENARLASTRGTGDVIRDALDAGVNGSRSGSAAQPRPMAGPACCARLVSASSGRGAPSCPMAARRSRARGIDASGLDPRLTTVRMTVASDVTNTLVGSRGAAATYGPQKGADPAAVTESTRHWRSRPGRSRQQPASRRGLARCRSRRRHDGRACSASRPRWSDPARRWWPSSRPRGRAGRGRPRHHRRGTCRRADAARQGGDGGRHTRPLEEYPGRSPLRRPWSRRRDACRRDGDHDRAADRRSPTDLATAMADQRLLLEAAAGRLARTIDIGLHVARLSDRGY